MTAWQRAGPEDANPAAPPSPSLLIGGARAPLTRATRLPSADELFVGMFSVARDVALSIAHRDCVSDLYRVKWSNAAHEEWVNAVLQNRHDLTRAQLERTRDLMNTNARDALVTDFEQC